MFTLWDYQQEGSDGIDAAYREGKKKVLYVLPTGGGKTVVFSFKAKQWETKGFNVLVLAHRKELLTQCGKKLHENNVRFGYLNPKFSANMIHKVQVGTMQTVVRRMHIMVFVPHLIIIDECHRVMGKMYQEILAKYPNAWVLGVTATPIRTDGKPLGGYFEHMILGPTVRQLIARGNLVHVRTIAPPKRVVFTEMELTKQSDGSLEWSVGVQEDKMDDADIIGDAVEMYRTKCPGLPAVVFCTSVTYAKKVAQQFREAGYLFKHIDGTMDDDERESILNDIQSGALHGITTVDLVTEGFDAPMLVVAIILRKTNSEGLYIQMCGRVLRTHPGKLFALIIDHTRNHEQHGDVTIDRWWSLDVAKEKKRKTRQRESLVTMRTCAACDTVYVRAEKCPECGLVYETAGRIPTQMAGNLIEHTEGYEDFAELIKPYPQGAVILRMLVKRAMTLDELTMLAERMGWRQDWPRKVWKGRIKRAGFV